MSIKIHNLIVSEILERVSGVIGEKSNKAIAEAMHTKPQAVTNWKTRNTIPWAELFEFSKEKDVLFDWLLTGKHDESHYEDLCDKYKKLIDHYKFLAEHYENQLKKYAKHPKKENGRREMDNVVYLEPRMELGPQLKPK